MTHDAVNQTLARLVNDSVVAGEWVIVGIAGGSTVEPLNAWLASTFDLREDTNDVIVVVCSARRSWCVRTNLVRSEEARR